MDVPPIFAQTAMDGARAVLVAPSSHPRGRVWYGHRVLACEALIRVGVISQTRAKRLFGFRSATQFTPEKLAALGVTPAHVSRLAQALAVVEFPVLKRRNVWTPEQQTTLETMAAASHSASEIAEALGMTRCMVCARASRTGVKLKGTPRGMRQRVLSRAQPAPRAPRLEPSPAATDDKPPLTARPWIVRGAQECAWPYEVDGAVYSCCAPVRKGSKRGDWQYCPRHFKKMFNYRAEAPRGLSHAAVVFVRKKAQAPVEPSSART